MVNGHVVNEEHLRNVPYAQPPQLFRNRRNGTFEDVTPAPGSGLDLRIIGRGAAYADYDDDGDLDLLLTTNQGAAYLLRNDTPRSTHFLRVIARGTRSNRDGIGAQVRLLTARRQLTTMVRTGSSYLSQSELPVTFGIKPGEQLDRLEILWPSGLRDVYRQLQPDTTFVAHEGASQDQAVVAQTPSTASSAEQHVATKRAAIAHYQAGRVGAAIEAFEQVLRTRPDDYIVQQYLIELYWRQGARDQARTLLSAIARELPEANFFMQFAFHLEEARLYDLAEAVYREAARLDPQAPEAPYRLGTRALQAGRYDEAVSHFREALDRRPHLLDALHGIGLAYAAQGKIDQAQAQFQAVIRLAPDFAEAHTHLAKIYFKTGRLDEAIAAYRRVITLEPNRAQGYHNLGSALAAKGLVEEAMAQFQEALHRDPHYLPARNDLGTLYAERGDFERAIVEFSAVVQTDPSWVQAHYNLAMAYAARGDVQATERELQATLRLDPRYLDAHLQLGMVYLQQGNSGAAAERFRTVVQLDPDHAMAHSALAALYFQEQQFERAWQHGQKAAQLGAPVDRLLAALRQVMGKPK
jgi:tetratricopeptide (TPR) repeat protein